MGLDSDTLPRPGRFRPLPGPSLAALVSCAMLSACTKESDNEGPQHLVRQVQQSNQNLALSFDGVDDYATTGTAQFPPGITPQTISARFLVESISGKHALITLRKDGDSGIELGIKDGVVGVWHLPGTPLSLLSAKTPVTIGVWHHAAYSYDGTTNRIYVDGVLASSGTTMPDRRTPTTCWLGTLDGVNDLFNGTIDDFRVFKVARTAAQIALEASGTFSSPEPDLVLDLPCNEASGDLIYDQSPYGNDGQLGDGVEQRIPSRVQSVAPSVRN